jgi:hypothetical protein
MYKTEFKNITILDTDKNPVSVPAACYGAFAAHARLGDSEEWAITHIPTGAAIALRFPSNIAAARILARLVYTLSDKQHDKLMSITDCAKASKSRLLKQCAKYLHEGARIERMVDVENAVGVFYADRYEVEQLRMKLNPDKHEVLDPKAGGDRMVADEIMRKVVKFY